MNLEVLQNIRTCVKNTKNSFLIVCHRDPDFDAIGSVLALSQQFNRLHIKHEIWIADKLGHEFSFLPGIDTVYQEFPKHFNYTHIIALDCSDKTRIRSHALLSNSVPIINIDHHHDNSRFGSLNIVEHISSVGELLLSIFTIWDWPLSKPIATCLYAAIIFDTGQLKYSSVTSETHHRVAALLACGIRHTDIHDYVFENKSLGYFKYLEKAIQRLKINQHLRYAYTEIPYTDKHYDITAALCSLYGVDIVLIMRQVEQNPETIKISFRSKSKFDVSAFARQFGGGGHKQAAGLLMHGSLRDIRNLLITALQDEIQD